MTAWSIAGQAIVEGVIVGTLTFGIVEVCIGLVRIVQTALFRRKLQQDLKRCAENWSEGYKVWKERQAA